MAKWIHVGHYATAGDVPVEIQQEVQKVSTRPGECEDKNDFCDAWAESGECKKNIAYMIGSAAAPGHCLKACNMCHLLKQWQGKNTQQQEQSQPEPATMATA